MLVTNTGKGKSRKESFPTTEMTVQLEEALEYGDPVVGYYSDDLTFDNFNDYISRGSYDTVGGGLIYCSWSPNGRYLSVISPSYSGIDIYDRYVQSGKITRTTHPIELPASKTSASEWSPNSRYLAVTHGGTPFITIYDWQSGSPVKMANPSVLPAGSGQGCTWSPDGRYLAIIHNVTPFITIYDWQSGSPVKIADPVTLPSGTQYHCAWSPNGRYLVIGHSTTPFVTVYDWQSGMPTKIVYPEISPTHSVKRCSWSPDGRYLSMAIDGGSRFVTYDWSSGYPVKIPDPIIPLTNIVRDLSWSPDGRYLAIGYFITPFVIIYDWQSGIPVKIADPEILPPGEVYGCDWSPDGRHLVLISRSLNTASHFGVIRVYDFINDILNRKNIITKIDSINDPIVINILKTWGERGGLGYSKKTLISGEISTFDLVRFGSQSWPNFIDPIIHVDVVTEYKSVRMKWRDPDNVIVENKIDEWAGTMIVRNRDHWPNNIHDGELVCNNIIHNQYSIDGFVDLDLDSDHVYFYQVFPYFKSGLVMNNPNNRFSATPMGEIPGDITSLSVTTYIPTSGVLTGMILPSINWNDPSDAIWNETVIVRKIGSIPANVNDGDIICFNSHRNLFSTTAFNSDELLPNKTYYFRAFIYSKSRVIRAGSYTSTTTPRMPVKITIPNLSQIRQRISGVGSTMHALLGGGCLSPGSTLYSTVDAYARGTFIRTDAPSLSKARSSMATARAGSAYMIFAGGGNGAAVSSAPAEPYGFNTVDAYYETSLTRTSTTLTWIGGGSSVGGAFTQNNALFAGGGYSTYYNTTVNSFNSSMTRGTPSALGTARGHMGCASFVTHALFAGGQGPNVIMSNAVDAYNNSLVRSSLTTLSVARRMCAGATVGGETPTHALFGGGYSTADTNTVDAYNTTLTRVTAPTPLSYSRSGLAGGSLAFYAMFMGAASGSGYRVIDAYTASLVKVDSKRLNGSYYPASADMGVAAVLIAGDSSEIVDAFTNDN